MAGLGLGTARAVLDQATKQSSNNKLIRKQSGKHVVLSSSDSLQHNSDTNALPYVGAFISAPRQMQVLDIVRNGKLPCLSPRSRLCAMCCGAQDIPPAPR